MCYITNMLVQILRSIFKHPFLWALGALLTFCLILFLISLISGDKNSTLEGPPTPIAKNDPEPKQDDKLTPLPGSNDPNVWPNKRPPQSRPSKEDSFEGAAEVVEGTEIAAERKAYNHLPYQSMTMVAEYKNQLSNGDLVIVARYRGTRERAQQEWQAFLDRHGDPGTAYLVVFKAE